MIGCGKWSSRAHTYALKKVNRMTGDKRATCVNDYCVCVHVCVCVNAYVFENVRKRVHPVQ